MDKKEKKKIYKEVFYNKGFIISFIALILGIISLFIITITGERRFEYDARAFTLFGIMGVSMYMWSYYVTIKEHKNVKKIKNGKIKYPSYIVDKKEFLEECKMGLMYSIVKIDGNIYTLETQLDNVNSKKYDKFICYINDIEIKGLDNFLNYKFDGKKSLNDLKKFEFLEYNNADPKKYFVDRIL